MRYSLKHPGNVIVGLAIVACVAVARPAQAGPVELFRNVQQNPMQPDQIVAAFIYGGGGLFVSGDGGKRFGLTCSGATNPNLKFERDISQMAVSGSGAVYLGLFNGLWRGQTNGCGFAQVPELMSHIIGAVGVDATDPKRVYVGTSDGYNPDGTPKINGLWLNDGTTDTFKQIGKQDTTWFSTLHVIKLGTGRRLYATGVVSKTVMDAMGQPASEVHYYVRVSDDEAQTWTDNEYDISQFGPKSSTAEFSIVAVDPMNPDRVLARVARDMMPDSFVWSPTQGKAGTWQQVAEIGELDGVEFAPDGKLYFGDDDQNSRAFYVVEKLGDAPKKLSENWKVGCLHWDASKNRMLACRDWQFGTVDLVKGQFTALVDMRCAENFVACPDEGSVKAACRSQLEANYCGVTHYPVAPLCSGYDQGSDASKYIEAQDFSCQGGAVVTRTGAGGGPAVAGNGSPAAAGQIANAAGTNAAGSAAVTTSQPMSPATVAGSSGSAAGASTSASSSSGCEVASDTGPANGAWLGVGLAWLWFRTRRRPH